MKNILIALLLIVASYTLQAKNDSTSVIKSGIGITLSPMVSMPKNASYPTTFKPGFSFAAGISSNLVVSKKYKLFIGIDLGYLTNAGTTKNIPNDITLIDANGNVNYKNISYFNVADRYHYAYLAVSIQKVIVKMSKNLFLFGGIGAQVNYNFSVASTTKNLVDFNGNNIDRTYYQSGADIAQNFSVSAFAKIGVMANLTKHLSFFAAPVFYYGFDQRVALYYKNNNQFNNLGINLQLIYAF